jgi:hypothetical protein
MLCKYIPRGKRDFARARNSIYSDTGNATDLIRKVNKKTGEEELLKNDVA